MSEPTGAAAAAAGAVAPPVVVEFGLEPPENKGDEEPAAARTEKELITELRSCSVATEQDRTRLESLHAKLLRLKREFEDNDHDNDNNNDGVDEKDPNQDTTPTKSVPTKDPPNGHE